MEHSMWLASRAWRCAVVLLVVMLAACSGSISIGEQSSTDEERSGSDEDDRDEDDRADEDDEDDDDDEGTPVESLLLEQGDCLRVGDTDDADLTDDVVVSCDVDHNYEVLAVVDDFNGQPLPDDPAATVMPVCRAVVDDLFGVDGLRLPGIVNFSGDVDDEGIIRATRCVLATPNQGIYERSAFDGDPLTMAGDWIKLAEMDIGDCFELGEEGDLGLPVDCDAGALVFLGGFLTDTPGLHPGADALRVERDAGCPQLLAELLGTGALDVEVDADGLSGTVPARLEWDFWDHRLITCDAPVVG